MIGGYIPFNRKNRQLENPLRPALGETCHQTKKAARSKRAALIRFNESTVLSVYRKTFTNAVTFDANGLVNTLVTASSQMLTKSACGFS